MPRNVGSSTHCLSRHLLTSVREAIKGRIQLRSSKNELEGREATHVAGVSTISAASDLRLVESISDIMVVEAGGEAGDEVNGRR